MNMRSKFNRQSDGLCSSGSLFFCLGLIVSNEEFTDNKNLIGKFTFFLFSLSHLSTTLLNSGKFSQFKIRDNDRK
jgi:hypothetical protein